MKAFYKLFLMLIATVFLVTAVPVPSHAAVRSAIAVVQDSNATPPDQSVGSKAAQEAEHDVAPHSHSAPHENENEQDQFKHSASVRWIANLTGLSLNNAYWLSVIVNFAIIAFLIVWASRKNLPPMFKNRTGEIQKAMEDARKASEDANRRLSAVESRLAKLGDEIAQMSAAGEKEADAEEERIKAAAELDARRIIESAEHEITAAAKAARRELTAYAADLAVSLARKQIHVDAGTDQNLVDRFASRLSSDDSARKGGR
jgi:F-type H+-transporting ATPase subunit b